MHDIDRRAAEIAVFLGLPVTETTERLRQGFGSNHAMVAQDFVEAGTPATEEALLDWYRKTDAYIWELSAYHLDRGFNYEGMCRGIAVHLVNAGKQYVTALGDGIGDLTIILAQAGLSPIYHDLSGSRTAEFAENRFPGELDVLMCLTDDWTPRLVPGNDAIVALDFFEHLPNVEEWAQACADSLNPGGLFLAQNAFAIGDPEHGGSIPMHLSSNNHFEQDWGLLLEAVGLQQDVGGWWVKP